MTLSEWRKLKKLENEDDFTTRLKVGENFLYGTQQINQMESKQVGDKINFFTVIKIEGKNCEYGLTFDTLESNYGG